MVHWAAKSQTQPCNGAHTCVHTMNLYSRTKILPSLQLTQVHSQCCTFCRLGQIHNDMYPPLQFSYRVFSLPPKSCVQPIHAFPLSPSETITNIANRLMNAKSFHMCPSLCNPMNYGPSGISVHGILQTRILEWVAMPLLQGIFPTQGSNPQLLCLLHWQGGSLPLAPPGKPNWLIHQYKIKTF